MILPNILTATWGFWQKPVIFWKSSFLTISAQLSSGWSCVYLNFSSASCNIFFFLVATNIFLFWIKEMISSTTYIYFYDSCQAQYWVMIQLSLLIVPQYWIYECWKYYFQEIIFEELIVHRSMVRLESWDDLHRMYITFVNYFWR